MFIHGPEFRSIAESALNARIIFIQIGMEQREHPCVGHASIRAEHDGAVCIGRDTALGVIGIVGKAPFGLALFVLHLLDILQGRIPVDICTLLACRTHIFERLRTAHRIHGEGCVIQVRVGAFVVLVITETA